MEQARLTLLFQGFTALHYACLASAIEVVKVLLEFHANPTVEDMTGCKAIDYAIDKSIIDMLKECDASLRLILFEIILFF